MKWNPFLKFPEISLCVFIVCCIPFFTRLGQFNINSQVEVLLAGDQRNYQSYQKIKEVISTNIPVFISLEVEDIYSPAGIQSIHKVSQAFDDMEGFVDAKSLTHSYKPVREGFSFAMVPLASTNKVDEETLSSLRDYCRENPLVRNVMTSPNDRHNLIWLTFNKSFPLRTTERAGLLKQFSSDLHSRMEDLKDEYVDYKIIGVPTVEDEVYQTLIKDVRAFSIWVFVLLVVLFGWVFRSFIASFLVVLNLLVAAILVPGVFVLLNFELSVFTVILLPLIGVIHLTLMTHLYLAFFQSQKSSIENPVSDAFGRIWKSSAFAALTTTISFLSLNLSDVSQVSLFGTLGAVGMVLVLFITFGPGLGLLVLVEKWQWLKLKGQHSHPPANEKSPVWIDRLMDIVHSRTKTVLAMTAIASILIGIGLVNIRADVRLEEFLSKNSPTRKMMQEMNTAYGGMNILQLKVDTGREYGITSVDNLKYLESLEGKANGIDGVTGVYSFAQVIAMMNQVWEQEKTGSLSIPDSSFTINMFISALRAKNYPFFKTLCDENFQTGNLIVRTQNMPGDEYLTLVDNLVKVANEGAPDGVNISAQAAIKSLHEANMKVMDSQTNTAGSTILIVFLMLLILWRSFKVSAISMIANILPVALVLSLTGWFQIPLNSITIMVGAIAFGIAVDDSVHFLTYLKEKLKEYGGDIEKALRDTFYVKGRPMFYTSVMLVVVFLLLGLSSFPPVRHFGFLGATAFAGALLSVFIFVPVMVLLTHRRSEAADTATPITD